MADRCYWHKDESGWVLIPACWPRVHDPDAECSCGEWSEATARQTIRSLKAALMRERHTVQTLRAELKRAGLWVYPDMADARALSARRRRREMHKAISEAGHG